MRRVDEPIGCTKKSLDETANIIKTIDEIAFQTNLQTLNFAVEVARTGETCEVAVVAEKVCYLVWRSVEAACNTSSLIEESQENAESGINVRKEVAEALNEIKENFKKAALLVNEVADAIDEQVK